MDVCLTCGMPMTTIGCTNPNCLSNKNKQFYKSDCWGTFGDNIFLKYNSNTPSWDNVRMAGDFLSVIKDLKEKLLAEEDKVTNRDKIIHLLCEDIIFWWEMNGVEIEENNWIANVAKLSSMDLAGIGDVVDKVILKSYK